MGSKKEMLDTFSVFVFTSIGSICFVFRFILKAITRIFYFTQFYWVNIFQIIMYLERNIDCFQKFAVGGGGGGGGQKEF